LKQKEPTEKTDKWQALPLNRARGLKNREHLKIQNL